MKLSKVRELKTFCSSLGSKPNWREVLRRASVEGEQDFAVNNVRFISEAVIFDVLVNELQHNRVALGSFSSWYIANATGWPEELVRMHQANGDYDLIGKNMDDEAIEELASIYANENRYGAHFNKYDGSTAAIELHNGKIYYAFDNR